MNKTLTNYISEEGDFNPKLEVCDFDKNQYLTKKSKIEKRDIKY